MDQRQFEHAVLHMVYGQGVRQLTPSSVAYQLGLGVKQAEKGLDGMVMDGTLDLDSDDDGNLFYYARDADISAAGAQSAPAQDAGAPLPPPGSGWPAEAPHAQPQSPSPPHGGFPYQHPQGGQGSHAYGPNPHGAAAHGAAPHAPSPYTSGPHGPSHFGPGAHVPGPPGAPHPGMGGQGYSNINPPPPPSRPQHMQAMSPYHGGAQGQLQHYDESGSKSPYTAALLSFFPGAGQLYNGQLGKALAFFFMTLVLYGINPIFGILTHGWAVLDAHNTSRKSQPYGLLPP